MLNNGDLVTGTTAELLRFNPDDIAGSNHDIDAVQITGVKISDSLIATDSLQLLKLPLRLSYQQNFLTIEWSKIDFLSLHEYQFYYRLIGANNNWINAGDKYSATYTDLKPGKYRFEVKAGEGVNATVSTSLKIVVAPPFWKTGWFITLLMIGCAAFIFMLIHWRIKTIRAMEREKIKAQEAKIEMLSINEKLSLAKLEALRSQMNPHFIFNCLTSIDNLIQTDEKEKATIFLAKFAKLVRSILETSKSNFIPCWKDMDTLKMYLEMEELRCDRKFRYSIYVSSEILNGDYKVPPLVVQPFVENAIHHGLLNKIDDDKELIIKVWASQHFIHYIISDNGVGREKAAAYRQLNKPTHQSMGMQITVDRINLLNQDGIPAVIVTDLYNERNESIRTKVEVNLLNQS